MANKKIQISMYIPTLKMFQRENPMLPNQIDLNTTSL